jgi:hypothetical protein
MVAATLLRFTARETSSPNNERAEIKLPRLALDDTVRATLGAEVRKETGWAEEGFSLVLGDRVLDASATLREVSEMYHAAHGPCSARDDQRHAAMLKASGSPASLMVESPAYVYCIQRAPRSFLTVRVCGTVQESLDKRNDVHRAA